MSKRKAPSGSGCIRQRSDGKWEGIATVKYNPVTHEIKKKSVYGKTQSEVRLKLSKIVSEIDSGEYIEPSKLTLEEWLNLWAKDYCYDKKESTMRGYKAAIRNHLIPELGQYRLCNLSAMVIQRFYNYMLLELKLSGKTIHNVHGVLSKALNQAVKMDMLKKNPCLQTTLPRIEKPAIVPLTDSQVGKLILLSGKDEVYGILLKLIVLTGLREAEAMGLTWDCVNFENGSIIINKQLQKRRLDAGGFRFASIKNDKSRSLKPASFVMDLLKQQKETQDRWKTEYCDVWQSWRDVNHPNSELVFTTLTGSYLSPQTVYNHFKVLAKEIGIPDARVHDLRHSYAVISIQNGDDIKTVQSNLGHSSASFTLDVYGHVSDRMKVESATRMDNYIKSLTGT